MASDFLTVREAADTLGVSTRHARRLAESGAVVGIARGLIDRDSVDRYLRSQRQGRTRAWAEHTSWAGVAMLSGQGADWLGATQASRLRSSLSQIHDVDDLLTRMRDRARVHTFEAHRAARPRLREVIASTNLRLLGITDAVDDRVDGYVAEADLDTMVRTHGLRADPGGTVELRTTRFDFDRVRELVGTTTVAALDAATDLDPRLQGVGRRALGELLKGCR